MTPNQPSAWPPVAGRSALRAVGLGLLAAAVVAALHTVFVATTEYELGYVSIVLGAVVGLTMRFSHPALPRIWAGGFAAALTLFSMLLSEYLIVHYYDFESASEDPAMFFFWGVSLLVAAQAAAVKDDDEAAPRDGTATAGAAMGDGANLDVYVARADRRAEQDGAISADRVREPDRAAPQDRLADPHLGPSSARPQDAAVPIAEKPAYGRPSSFEPVWDPSTAITGTGAAASTPPPRRGFGDDGGPTEDAGLRPGWAVLSASIVAIAVGLATVGVLREWHQLGAPPWAHAAGQTGADQSAGQPADHAPGEVTGRLVDYPDLRVGDCVRDMESEDLPYLEVVSCKRPHSDEVVGTFTLSPQRWPGQKRVDQLAERGCRPLFEEYVGVSADDSSLEWFSDAPVKIGWPEDRSVVCTAASGLGSSRGSVRGAGR